MHDTDDIPDHLKTEPLRDPTTYWPAAVWISVAWLSMAWMVHSMAQCSIHS